MTHRFLKLFCTLLFAVWASASSAMFISPDPLDPTGPGVGTNRYAYSGGDPINRADPSGHAWVDRTWDNAFGEGSFDRTFGDGASESMDQIADRYFGDSGDRAAERAYANSGTTLGYDDWRFSTGNLTGLYLNDAYDSAVPVASRNDTVRIQFESALINLSLHEAYGGHTIQRHVNHSDAQLRSYMTRQTLVGPIGFGRRTHGSFTSLASAERLVSSTIASRPDLVATVISGARPDAMIDKAFGSITGREAYRVSTRINSPVIIRPSHNVRLVIRPHQSLTGGFHVITSFPHNNPLMPY